ncbi:plasmid replication protein RepC [Breoghania sp. JC706]|uniref:plasmid replication protein RepC n=1 Tax=Breoghania sp. JC706 TaxID=3117732 RepID=UPI0030095891
MMETGGFTPAPSGWRKATPGLCRASALASDGEGEDVTRNRAMLALRRVAPAIGLRPGDVLLLDTLAVFTRPCDWEAGARPIVWPSNDYLMEATGLSLSAVKRRLRKLAEAGVIAYRDSSNGKRWGRRDEDGRIREAYGFDLGPLAARTAEFEALHATIRAERDLRKSLQRRITILRRSVRAMLDEASGAAAGRFAERSGEQDPMRQGPVWQGPVWQRVARGYGILMARLQGAATMTTDALCDLHDAFTALREEAEAALRAEVQPAEAPSACPDDGNFRNMDPSGAGRDPHIPITTHLQSVRCNSLETACARPGRKPEAQAPAPVAAGGEREDMPQRQTEIERQPETGRQTEMGRRDGAGPEGEAIAAGAAGQMGRRPEGPTGGRPDGRNGERAGEADGEAGLTLRTILFACPAFAETAHGLGRYIRNWREFALAADTIRPMVGISGDAWQGARAALGERRAAAALALIADKVAEGSVASPGGYLRGLIAKAERGELRLARSVYGRLSERRRVLGDI